MKTKDFKDFSITRVTPRDIIGTRAPLDSVNLFLVLAVDRFVGETGLPFEFLRNGLTTGIHRASWHPRGLAVDGAFPTNQDRVKIYEVWKTAIECGFRGIGLYWNGVAYSVHMDLRPRLAFWGGSKREGGEWSYFSVFRDPREHRGVS